MLWYISTYLWFVLLTPMLLPLFRRIPLFMLGLPFLMLYALENHSPDMSDAILGPAQDICTYLACWLLGFAHHDGLLHRLKWRTVLPLVLAAAAIGGWLTWIGRENNNFDLTTDAMPNAFWSFAFVLLLPRCRPSMAWLVRVPWLERLLDLLNGRAVTVYLWHNPGIFVVGLLLELVGRDDGLTGAVLLVFGTLLWTALATLIFGWVEDISARRRPGLLPPDHRRRTVLGSSTVPFPTTAAS